MLVCALTKFAFATKLTSRLPPKPELMLVVKGVYAIEPGAPLELLDRVDCAPSGDTFAEDDDDRAGACFTASDFADAKLNAEVLVRASFHAPGKRAVKESEVGFTIGSLRKRLRVVGPRAFADDLLGSMASEPLPMTTCVVDWTNAYGGPEFISNPSGRGHTSTSLPQVEAIDAPVTSRGNHNVAASFGPISPFWSARSKKVGTRYGKDWQETRAPFVSEDFDWTFHHAAPADQQVSGYLRGDETLTLENLHPDASQLAVKLPSVRVRAFARFTTGEFRAFSLNLDTVTADLSTPSKSRLALTWRGHLSVRELDFKDVRSLLIATESLGESKTEREYQVLLDAFEKDPIGMDKARADMLEEMRADVPAEFDGAYADVISADLAKQLPPELRGVAAQVAVSMKEARKARGDGPDAAEVDAKLEESLKKAREAADDEPPVPVAPKPGAMPSFGARKIVRRIMAETARTKELVGASAPERQAEFDKLDAVPHDPAWSTMDPEYSIPEPLSTDAPGPYVNLIDRDFTGQDLSGLDLRGAKLDGAVLTRANLSGANLRGASLRGAVLFRTNAEGTDFTEADLTRANCAKLEAAGALFTDAILELAFFEDAVLQGATFHGTKAEWTAFARANLTELKGKALKFFRCDLADAKLSGADLSEGSVRACVLSRADATGANLTGTEIRAVSAEEVNLRGAKLVRAYGERVNFQRATLDEADFSLSTMRSSHFSEGTAKGAEFWGADLAASRFYRSDVSSARFDRANLIGADLSRATMHRARFEKANLYDAKLVEAVGEDTDFSGANLERCNYTRRSEQA